MEQFVGGGGVLKQIRLWKGLTFSRPAPTARQSALHRLNPKNPPLLTPKKALDLFAGTLLDTALALVGNCKLMRTSYMVFNLPTIFQ
jgi:hypothetical protein